MTENVILVDSGDTPLGFAEKTRCHRGSGMLHRAFTAMLFDDSGRLLLTRRSPSKMLWPGKWDGTVASHPRAGEDFVSSAERRLPEELGVRCALEYLFKFEYHVSDGDRGSENEICGTLIGRLPPGDPAPDPAEIVQTMTVSRLDASRPKDYCPWMILALALLPGCGDISSRYNTGSWLEPATTKTLLEMASHHLPPDRWRVLP